MIAPSEVLRSELQNGEVEQFLHTDFVEVRDELLYRF